jgi:outer membrane protein assembly factor BamB
MKLLQRFQKFLSQQGLLALSLMVIVLLGVLQIWLQRPPPFNTHTIGSSTQHVDVLWLMQDGGNQGDVASPITANTDGTVFIMSLAYDTLTAINIKSGATIWKAKIPFEQSDVRSLLADQNTVFVVTGGSVDAYESTTGKLKWSTRLGDEHVSVFSQLTSTIVRVYYGDKLYEIDSKTGKVLSTLPKNNIIWVSDSVVFEKTPAYQLRALNKQTGDQLWTSSRWFTVGGGYKPQDTGKDKLIAAFATGICALNIRSGEYDWCHPEIYLSSIAIDYQSQLGYAMRKDLVLLTIDLQTGNVLGETSFSSSKPINRQTDFVPSVVFSDGVVVVYFNDSGQIFGLSLK